MNLFQRIARRFGREYVLLRLGNDLEVRHAYELGGVVYADPYLPHTRTELLPKGQVDGHQCYVKEWRPLTPKTWVLFNSQPDQMVVELSTIDSARSPIKLIESSK